jgi:hypothetical protein
MQLCVRGTMNRSIFRLAILGSTLILASVGPLRPQTLPLEPAAIPEFSVNRGFYTETFDVVVGCSTLNAVIVYTLDGSDPRSSPTTLQQNSPATIHIDPESTDGQRGKTPGVILRACASAADHSVSESVTHTYLFINKIGSLSPNGTKPGPGWPNPVSSPQYIDYGMDPDVLNDSRYMNLIDDAMLAIPTLSIATDLKHLFSSDSGIYMHAMEDGIEWERPTSLELLNPDGTEGFQINAGIRIRGGWSAHGENPKHAFRFFFRSEYGAAKLKFPLFELEGVDEFDKIDLRTSQNYSWSYPGHQGEYNTMNRDVFSRDLQRETGNPYARSRYYHLYIDGVYWGLFQSQERPDASFAVSYLGGMEEDYDVIKISGDYTYVVEATDGNLDAYNQVWNLCTSGFSSNTNYFKIQGLNTNGTRNPAYPVLVELDNLIDYMLIIFYAGNYDSPVSKFGSNKIPNNFFAIRNRNSDEGFRFFVHDAEHTLRTTSGEGPGIGLNENRVNIGDLTDGNKMVVSEFSKFHPQWLHYRLSVNAEYKIRFADHVYRHFFNLGCMTPGRAAALFMARAQEIDMAIIGESARWGDIYHSPSRYKDDDWLWAVDDIVNNYLPVRTGIVLNQLKTAALYPTINPPVFLNNEVPVLEYSLQIPPGYMLKLRNPNGTSGSIKYTTNGQDPRNIGGTVGSSALDGGDETEITLNSTTTIKARILNGTTWSALHELVLYTGEITDKVKITEIHYHPLDADTVNDDELEFLELKNTGTYAIGLSQVFITDAINYSFPIGTVINPGAFIVLASNGDQFNLRYNFMPFGEYTARLDNGGERMTFCTVGGDTIMTVQYDDQSPWPVEADGGGYSLVPIEINPSGNMNDPAYWRASYAVHGSPGRDDTPTTSMESALNGIPGGFRLSQNYPNPFNPVTRIDYTLHTGGKVSLVIYDLIGREVTVLVDRTQPPGTYQVNFNASGLGSGIYFYRLESADGVLIRKMALLK